MLFRRGKAYLEKKDFVSARKDFEEALKVDSECEEIVKNELATIEHREREYDKLMARKYAQAVAS